jgi:hypothetical protein
MNRSEVFARFDLAMFQLRVIAPSCQQIIIHTLESYRQARESQIKQAESERSAFILNEQAKLAGVQ